MAKNKTISTKRAPGSNGKISSPYVQLTLKQKSDTQKAEEIFYQLDYIAPYASTSSARNWTLSVGSTVIKSGTFTPKGKTGTHNLCSGSYTAKKKETASSITFNIYFPFDITWGNTSMYSDTYRKASGTYSVGALPDKVTISYSGSGWKNVPSNASVLKGSKYEIPSNKPIKTGSKFLTWYTGTIGQSDYVAYAPDSSFVANANKTLKLRYETSKYTITYNANGGSMSPGQSTTQLKEHGQTVKLYSALRNDYEFQGWGTAANSTNVKYIGGFDYSTNSDIKLYAVWKAKPKAQTYTITYNGSGGTGTLPASQTFTYGTGTTLRSGSSLSKQDYRFLGWSTKANSKTAEYSAGASYDKIGNVTMYAVWASTKATSTGSNTPHMEITDLTYQRGDLEFAIVTWDGVTGWTFLWVPNNQGTSLAFGFSHTIYATSKYDGTEWGEVEARLYCDGVDVYNDSLGIGLYEQCGTREIGSGDLGGLDPEKEYYLVLKCTDATGTIYKSQSIGTDKYPIDVRPRNQGISFGKAAVHDSYADFRWHALFTNKLGLVGETTHGSIVGTQFQPCNENNNCVIGYGLYNLSNPVEPGQDDRRTNIYGRSIYLATKDSNVAASWRPYFRKGDKINISKCTFSGHITSTGRHLQFFIPLTKPIIGSPTIGATWSGGIMIRQSGPNMVTGSGVSRTWSSSSAGYSWGSTGSSYITKASMGSGTNLGDHPISLSITYIEGVGLKCQFTITNCTDPNKTSGEPYDNQIAWLKANCVNNGVATVIFNDNSTINLS